MPKPRGEAAKKLLKKPNEGRPEWDPQTLAWAVEQVHADSAKFLEHCGKPGDYWDLGKYGVTDIKKIPDTNAINLSRKSAPRRVLRSICASNGPLR